ncbi:DUF2304 domain-containing protein [Erysipelotrichia bacterium]
MTGFERIQLISLAGSLFFMLGVLELIRRQKIKEAYALLWLIFGSIFILLSFWKSGLDYFAGIFGIYYPPALLFLILIVAVILILVSYSAVISSQNDKIRALTQEIALMKVELEKLGCKDRQRS